MSYINKPIDYMKNVAKEYSDWYRSSGKAEAKQASEAWGALLQGRRYNEAGEQLPVTRKISKINRNNKK